MTDNKTVPYNPPPDAEESRLSRSSPHHPNVPVPPALVAARQGLFCCSILAFFVSWAREELPATRDDFPVFVFRLVFVR